jgi:hypothetical protein
MSEQHPLLQAYLNGELDGQGFVDFNAWLREDPAHLREFAVAAFLANELGEALGEQGATAQPVVVDKASAAKQGQTDAEVLNLLRQLEAEAEVETVMLEPLPMHKADDAGSLSVHDLAVVGGYLLRKTFTNKKVITTGIGVAAAAVLLLALILINPFASDTPDPLAHDSDTGPAAVATITAQNQARWASTSPSIGKQLLPGQRLTLIDGFAEITTKEGAVAILEAPCTIEFTGNAKALRLHRGKLVGKCPTWQSKGFTVLTPSTQVIDLGTEFGVEVEGTGETNVVVFDGLVALAAPDDDVRTAELTEVAAGQAKRIDRAGRITAIDPASTDQAFVRSADPDARYEQMVLADKPLVYYRMDQVIGGVARNLAADRYHAKVFGDSTTATDGLRSSVSLASFGDYLQTTEPIAELRGAESYTMECWVKLSQHGFGVIGMLASNNSNSEVGVDTAARLETTGSGRLGIGPRERIRYLHMAAIESEVEEPLRDHFNELFTPDEVALSQWMHLAAVNDGGRFVLYLNGEKVSEARGQGPLIDRDLLLTIGRFSTKDINYPAQTRQFIGELDEFAVCDHALSPEAIRARFEAGQFWLTNE